MSARMILPLCGWLCLTACGVPAMRGALQGHLTGTAASTPSVPETEPLPASVPMAPTVEPVPPVKQEETYTVSVQNLAVRDLLFMLARDARLDLDIHADVRGEITLNAVHQPISRLLRRISRQAALRFERDGDHLVVLPDTPYLRHYKVDYVNLVRQVNGTVSTSTQIATDVGRLTDSSSSSNMGNVSSTRVENISENQFWRSLEKNIREILSELGGATESAPSVIVHPESGVVTARATQAQHETIEEFIRRVEKAARRQVMIEATIVEVVLNDGYQQGIEWNRVWSEGGKSLGLSPPALVDSANAADRPFVLNFQNHANPIALTLNLLQSFGTAKVLSSPRLSVLNNQTALLKVVENVVYFSIKADVTPGNANNNAVVAYTTTPQTVSVGLVMTVTPQVGGDGNVILNVRPTISSISGMVKDPNPDIPNTLSNEIPQIRTREIESVLRVASGEIAVLGGLMEDRVDYATGRLPLLGQIPFVGELFTSRNNAARKSELVIFLRPVIIQEPALGSDYAALKSFLPDPDFFRPHPGANPFPVLERGPR